jgi:hypothetical protein
MFGKTGIEDAGGTAADVAADKFRAYVTVNSGLKTIAIA